MKIAGYVITILGALALLGTILGGHSPIGPLFWIAVGVVLLVLGYRKKAKDTGEIQRAEHIDKSAFPLLQRIVRLTTPDNFMEPYDAKRVKRAVELNKQANDIDGQQPLQVLDLLETTTKDLGCTYESEVIYQYLLAIYKPTTNQSDFEWCNNLCQQLYNVKDNVDDMISLVRREIARREQIRKEEIERKRQEIINRHQEGDEEIKQRAKKFLKVCFVILPIVIVFFAIYIPVDYHRINKHKPNGIWSLSDSRLEQLYKSEKGGSNNEISYLMNIPKCFEKDKYNMRYLEKYHIDCSFHNFWGNHIDVAITSLPINDFVNAKVNEYEHDGYKIEYKINTDSLAWFTYDKYSLSDGRLVGNCICILKPSPLQQSPFPLDQNNIMICCDGYGVNKEIADSVANSMRIKTGYLQNNEYGETYKLAKYRSVKQGDWLWDDRLYASDYITTRINYVLPHQYGRVLSLYHNIGISALDNYENQSWFLTSDNEAGLYVKSTPTTSIINFVYPIDSIRETSITKCKVAGCNATKIEATGYHNDREYKYITYQLIKDNGYSEYKEPIYGKETFYKSDEEIDLFGYNYINGQPSRKGTRNVLKGYKPGVTKIKNEDLYLCLLFGMTPEWYENNKVSIDAVINSIQIKEN